MILPSSGTYITLSFFHTYLCIFWLHDSFYPEQGMLHNFSIVVTTSKKNHNY